MIGWLSGIVKVVGETDTILDVGGVGYLLLCGSRTLSRLSEGAPAELHVETHVRETAITLYGFIDDEERAWFVKLQDVQGVGPKAALAILDVLSTGEVMSAIALEDKASFARASGVGPRLAQRIVTELHGKAPPSGRSAVSAFTAPQSGDVSDDMRREGLSDMTLRNDAVSALVNLGIGQSDALRAVSEAYKTFDDDPALNDLVRAALKEMSQ